MALRKIVLQPGVNRENSRYASENTWYECDNIRFRQGTPEKIGGWQRISTNTFLGIAKSLWNWVTLTGQNLIGVGTNLKFYIESGGMYHDITPLSDPPHIIDTTDPFTIAPATSIATVTDEMLPTGALPTSFVSFKGVALFEGFDLNNNYQIIDILDGSFTIDVGTVSPTGATGGGNIVEASYEINTGYAYFSPREGWGVGGWGAGNWSESDINASELRLWSQSNFGQDLIIGMRDGPIFYWEPGDFSIRAVRLDSKTGHKQVPNYQRLILVSDVERFVFAFGGNDYGTETDTNPLQVRWSNQGSAVDWEVRSSGTAGFLILSRGTEIIAALQARQELLVWTDSSLYSLQYAGAPTLWTAQLVGDNISTVSQNCTIFANGITYWMGKDKFYQYDGRTQPLRCDLRKFVFDNFNKTQYNQVFTGSNEAYHEVWWFYCTEHTTSIDRYVVYNYMEDVWYYGSMARSAWLDSGLRDYPLAATYINNLVNHEQGVDDNASAPTKPIHAYITSGEFDIDDGQQFSFIWRVLPDIRFTGSTVTSPTATMTLLPAKNSGSGYNVPTSEGGSNEALITSGTILPIEQFTGQVYTRVRGRQLAMKIESTGPGITWQLGVPRIDMRPDGRR